MFFPSLAMTSLSTYGTAIAASATFDAALQTVRELTYHATGNAAALEATASTPFLGKITDSGGLPDILSALSAAAREDTDSLAERKIETFGQAARYLMEHS